jgi:hypothetical protein
MTLGDFINPAAIITSVVWIWNKVDARLDKFEIALTNHMVKTAEDYATKPEVKEAVANHEKAFHQ